MQRGRPGALALRLLNVGPYSVAHRVSLWTARPSGPGLSRTLPWKGSLLLTLLSPPWPQRSCVPQTLPPQITTALVFSAGSSERVCGVREGRCGIIQFMLLFWKDSGVIPSEQPENEHTSRQRHPVSCEKSTRCLVTHSDLVPDEATALAAGKCAAFLGPAAPVELPIK